MGKILLALVFLEIFLVPARAVDCLDLSQYTPNPNCPAVYDPVCGCNGKTYGNACEATQSGVTSYTSGVCASSCYNADSIDNGIMCPAVYEPVCGCDGNTYSNACVALRLNGVLSYEEGECPTGCRDTALLDTTVACLGVIDPVCGCDSITYNNSCEAIYYYGVAAYSDGPCPLYYCQDFSRIDSAFNCVPVNQPVCGCNGTTYPNACTAEKYNGVSNWTNGACLTGIAAHQLKNLLQVYPNPAAQQLWIELLGSYYSGTITLLDITGKQVDSLPLVSGRQKLDVAGLQAGTYFIHITTTQGTAIKRVSIVH